MRQLKFIFLFWICCQFAFSQNRIKGYEYWFDNGYAARQSTSVTASPVYLLTTQIGTEGLVPGTHILHVRFFDDSSRYSAVQSQFFFKLPPAAAANSISQFQYWFDTEFANAQTISAGPGPVVELTTLLNSSDLISGLHMVHVRFKDTRGGWSETYSQVFYCLPNASPTQRQVVRYQYWFDDQYGNNTTQTVSSGSEITIPLSLNALHLPAGLHTFHLRVQDNGGFWSSPQTTHFYRLPQQSATGRNIVRFHYWFDNDLATGVMQSVTAQPILQMAIAANANALPAGMHFFRIRVQDDNGFWSGTQSDAFYVLPPGATIPNLITAYQYWLNENDNQKAVVNLEAGVNPFQTPIQVDLSTIAAGKHAIRFQFKDSRGQWSTVTTDSITVQAFTQYTFTGNGNWSVASNWANNAIPPATVPDGREVIIDHTEGGECVMDVPVIMAPGSKLTVKPGKKLRIVGNLIHQ
jgi:hypothetical protein